ncbi:hypothetical protein [Bradyrhizobium sp. USDA 4454]
MADRIVQRISLEGAEDVQAKLKKTGEVGAKALADTNKTIGDQNSGLAKYGDVFAGLTGKTEESREQLEGIKKVLETIKPAAEKAGLEIGGIGEFSKIGRGGIVALGAAIGTTLLTAIEKVGDTARSQAQRLGVFAGSAQKGVEAYRQLQKTGQELKVPTASLAEPFEQIARANQRFGNQLSGGQELNALKSLFTGAEADRVGEEQANPAIKTFLAGLQDGGRLTPELAKGFSDVLPTLMKRLLEDLQSRLPGASVYSAPETLKSLGNILPQLEEDQKATQATFGTSIGQSLSHLKSEASKLGDALNGSQIVSATLDGAAKFLGATAEGIKAIKEARHEADFKDDLKPNPAAVRATGRYRSPGDAPLSPDELGTPGIVAQPIDKIQGGEGDQVAAADSMDKTAKSAEQLSAALDKTTDSAEGAQHVFDRDRALHLENALGAAAAKFATEQARIDSKFKPEEVDLQVDRDRLAVDTASIAKQSAQIGVQEAAKGKDLADLAPEQAESASRNAESRYTKALSNLRRLQGYDTSFLDRRNVLQDASDELADADTARKVANVNRRYAYLEPQKAELAQRKAQTELTSADYLARDSSLKLAKDEQQRPLSTDVAGLRYQQAQLDEQKKLGTLGVEEVKLLDEILSTLHKQSEDQAKKSEGRGSEERSSGGSRQLGEAGAGGTAGTTSAAPSGRDLLGAGGVVNIPPGATQDEINRALAKQRGASQQPTTEQPNLAPKEAFRADQDQAIEDLKADWKSQRELNAQLHNGGAQNAPVARTRSGVSQNYPPPVRGHYDDNYNFVPDVPTDSGLGRGSVAGPGGSGGSIPATNDYEFAGRRNPAGPYQEGISTPLTFPQYNRDQQQNLPSIYPNGVPLPQPRPPEADQGQQSSLPDAAKLNGLSSAFDSFVQAVVQSLNSGKSQVASAGDQQQAQAPAASAAGEAGQGLDQTTGQVKDSLQNLASAIDSAADKIHAGGAEAGTETVHAAGGGEIHGPGTTTSDSVPAMLSRKEFVVKAASAQKHLGLLHAINDGRDILHFAIGGPVGGVMGDIGMPSLKGVGFVAPSSPKSGDHEHHGSLDLRTDNGTHRVFAPGQVLRALRRDAQESSVARTGRMPFWYK